MALNFCRRFRIGRIALSQNSIYTTTIRPAGHSKWANIRHIKATKDGQRSVLFGRLVRQIRLAIQEGGSSNPQTNSQLRNAVDDALKKSMPMATVQNTIRRFDQSKSQLRKHIVEMKFINSSIYMVCIMFTDNLAALRMTMTPVVKKAGAAFIDARHLFDDRGVIEATIDPKKNPFSNNCSESLEELCTADAIEYGAEDVEIIDPIAGHVRFLCDPIEMDRISRQLTRCGYSVESVDHIFVPKVWMPAGEMERKQCEILRDKLKTLDGIDEIYDNILVDDNVEEEELRTNGNRSKT